MFGVKKVKRERNWEQSDYCTVVELLFHVRGKHTSD